MGGANYLPVIAGAAIPEQNSCQRRSYYIDYRAEKRLNGMDIYQEISARRAEGKSFVLATLIRTTGSVPRDVGAKMLVYADGSIAGTIGGGKFEKQIIEDCLTLFESKTPHLLKGYRLEDGGPETLGMFCGGEADVFMELFGQSENLIIFGGGHVGRDLARVASGLEFKIAIVDDRPEILAQYQPPIQTVLTDYNYQANYPQIDGNSYVVIVTHGHRCDREVLQKVIDKKCAYIGMIGSKTKISKTYALLEEAGVDKALLQAVHSPIGMDIGAEGPYEIAVAIAAEIIKVRSKSSYRK
jgi:xanthine dehydrogenase accessory factor